jgi:hypothetical protein
MEEELKENIQREILELPQEELIWVNISLFKWYGVCVCVCVYTNSIFSTFYKKGT